MEIMKLCSCIGTELIKPQGVCDSCGGSRPALSECICICYRDRDTQIKLEIIKYRNPTCKFHGDNKVALIRKRSCYCGGGT
jgi:hypothetical protein